MIVALGKEDVSAEKRLQFDTLEKKMQQIDAAKVCDVLSGERNF